MVICRNCHTSWPDDCKFCGMCGYQVGELTDVETLRLAGHAKHLKKGWNRSRLFKLTSIVLSLIVVLIATAVSFYVYFSQKVFNAASPEATLTVYGKAIAGQTLQVIGQHFTPNQTVFVSIDGQPLAKDGIIADMWPVSARNLSLVSQLSTNSGGTAVTVQADGTFSIEIHVDNDWTVGSSHYLSVVDQQGKEIKGLYFIVAPDRSTLTPIPSPTPAPVPNPTATPSPTPTPTPRPSPTPTPTPKPTPPPTPTPTSNTTPTPTSLPRPSPTPTSPSAPTPSPTVLPRPSPTPTRSSTPRSSPTVQ